MEISGQVHAQFALPQEGTSVCLEYENGWGSEPVGHFGDEKNVLPLPTFKPRTV